jgi:hypothetical protein
VVVNNYAATDKPDWGISDWGKAGTGSEDPGVTLSDYGSAEDNRDELDIDSANDESDKLARDNAHSPATSTRHLPAFVWLGSAIESLMELIVKSEFFGAVDLVPEMREMQFKLQGAQDRDSTGAPAGGYEITAAKAGWSDAGDEAVRGARFALGYLCGSTACQTCPPPDRPRSLGSGATGRNIRSRAPVAPSSARRAAEQEPQPGENVWGARPLDAGFYYQPQEDAPPAFFIEPHQKPDWPLAPWQEDDRP